MVAAVIWVKSTASQRPNGIAFLGSSCWGPLGPSLRNDQMLKSRKGGDWENEFWVGHSPQLIRPLSIPRQMRSDPRRQSRSHTFGPIPYLSWQVFAAGDDPLFSYPIVQLICVLPPMVVPISPSKKTFPEAKSRPIPLQGLLHPFSSAPYSQPVRPFSESLLPTLSSSSSTSPKIKSPIAHFLLN